MADSRKTNGSIKRRDFLARAGSTAIALPLAMKAAVFAPSRAAAATRSTGPIVRLGIYPAIGICRVGGSAEYFLAPEVPGLALEPQGGYKDADGQLRKQVQRFRVYGFDAEGNVVQEVTAADAQIEWSVHVANTKGAWYGFNNPLDNGDLAPGLPGQRRNQNFTSNAQRERMLVIDGGQTSIEGADTNPDGTDDAFRMGGLFYDQMPVGLGHLQTDGDGRLMVFPPDGVSQAAGQNVGITSFADNDGWHDDWCDGPVNATVTFPGQEPMVADGSWVASCGPNFAPEIPPVTTLFDVVNDLNIRQGWSPEPVVPLSFRKHIYPIFYRLGLMKWVSSAANLRQAWADVGDFSDPAYIEKLADPSPENLPFRTQVLSWFRDPNETSEDAFKTQQYRLPYMLGDGINYSGSPLQWFQFLEISYFYLQLWAEGAFVNDLNDADLDGITTLDQVDLQQQPFALTEAALEPCSGGAFHPGVELTYYLRLAPMYARNTDPDAEPFRLARGDRPSLIQDLGPLLTPEVAFNGFNGTPPPIGPQMPGDLTRWMGLPWQCDAYSCGMVELQEAFPVAIWWPALIPGDILPEEYYTQLMRTDLSPEERLKFYEQRVNWSRGVPGIGYHANASYWDGITRMIYLWQRMGFIVKRPGPTDPDAPAQIPDEMFVEVGRGDMELLFDWTPPDGPIPLPSDS